MKIEKGKLYLDVESNTMFKADMTTDNYPSGASNKIAVHCPVLEDRKFISEKTNFKFDDYDSITREVFYLDEEVTSSYDDYKYYYKHEYKLITIDQFKEFYPDVETSDTSIKSIKSDCIVNQVTEKYQERSKVGIEKYNTTLEDNKDGILTFLNHLQEELMDATLYIQKLKNQFEELKGKL